MMTIPRSTMQGCIEFLRLTLFNLVCLVNWSTALDNGLARTPMMGFLSWERFRCNTDCKTYPEECISENLFKRTADLMVSENYKDCGYEYVVMDACWYENNNYLRPNRTRFPNGIRGLSDYIHSKGLKFGLLEDLGANNSKSLSDGINGHLKEAANLIANEWHIDYVKLIAPNTDLFILTEGYTKFERYLNATGRPIVLSCGWPAYLDNESVPIDYKLIQKTCNSWRNTFNDIDDSYDDMTSIIDYFALKQDYWRPLAGPGHWNDPDQLIIGDFSLSYDQAKVQMSIWAILAAPLLMSVDLKTIKPDFKAILQNRKVIAVNQDALGIQGKRVYQIDSIDCWTRPIEPVVDGCYSYACVFMSRRTDGTPYLFSVKLDHIGLKNKSGYRFTALYAEDSRKNGTFVLKPNEILGTLINPLGCTMFKAEALPGGSCCDPYY